MRTLGGATVLGAGTVAAASPAAAQPPDSGSGTGEITDIDVTVIRETETNRFEERILDGSVNGTLEGTFVQEVSGKVHKKTGSVVFRGTMTFDGELENCGSGTLNLRVSGKGRIVRPGFPITEASVRVVDQSENDIDATGQGTVFQEGQALEYDIQYKCRG